jgi:hypothetical protein
MHAGDASSDGDIVLNAVGQRVVVGIEPECRDA